MTRSVIRSIVTLLALTSLLTGCAADRPPEPPFEPLDVASIASGLGSTAARAAAGAAVVEPEGEESSSTGMYVLFPPEVPEAAEVREHVAERRWEEAAPAFDALAGVEPDPTRRAELYFAAAECWLAAGEHEHEAWKLYEKLLRLYPGTARYEIIVDRLFLIGRRFCDGHAERPSVLLGMNVQDRKLGIKILDAFQRARERHPLADDALHHVALAQLELEEHELAIAAWQTLMDEYPRSEWAETAEYRIAITFALMSDGVEYDKRPLFTSLSRMRRYLERHPTGDHLDEATAAVQRLEQDLARHQLTVARFYLRRDRRYAAQLTLDELVREYPRTDAASEAIRLQRSLPRTSPPPAPPEPEEPPVDPEVAPPPPDVLAAPAD